MEADPKVVLLKSEPVCTISDSLLVSKVPRGRGDGDEGVGVEGSQNFFHVIL